MKDLTKELQERNRESLIYLGGRIPNEEFGIKVSELDTLTAQTVQATLERVREIVGEVLNKEYYGLTFKQDKCIECLNNQRINDILQELNNI